MSWWGETKLLLRACLRKEGLAFIALMVSLGGAIIMSAFLFGNLLYFREQKATDELFYLSCAMLAIIAITFWSSHRLLGSSLAIEAEVLSMKLKLNQGGEDA